MVNSKGQTLVIFVLILPILLLLLALIWEIGNLSLTTNKYETTIKNAIEYGLNNQEKENLEVILTNLIKANVKGDVQIEIKNYIKINVKQKYDTLYNNLFNHKFDIDITYIGYKKNNQIIIKKE